MSPEAQRIAIAEACGWELRTNQARWFENGIYRPDGSRSLVIHPDGDQDHIKSWDQVTRDKKLPDYLNDLNAMHEAEKVLMPNQTIDFACYLTEPNIDEIYNVIPHNLNYHVCFPAIHSSAAQRAEAFLRTLNLWDDSK